MNLTIGRPIAKTPVAPLRSVVGTIMVLYRRRVKDNVLVHLPDRHPTPPPIGSPNQWEQSRAWKPRKQIADELRHFVQSFPPKYEFWGYYSAYDHVALCQLFGTMMDLPKGFPMYTRDLKQWCDMLGNPKLPEQGKNEHHALLDAKWNASVYEFLKNYRADEIKRMAFQAAADSGA